MTQGWQPTVMWQRDVVATTAVRALHRLFDGADAAPGEGSPLPPLWHWLAFLPDAPQRDLGEDGHARTGVFLPPSPLAQRMFAGGRYVFHEVPHVGELLIRRSEIASVEDKQGRSGPLRFVTVRHELFSGDSLALTEEQDIVYRDPAGTAGSSRVAPSGDAWDWAWDLAIDSKLLFRFSALTYNAHRIHYDRAYATEVEGYPGLVVHGPLQAVALLELVRRKLPGHQVRGFQFRAKRPVFDDGPLLVRGRQRDGRTIELATFDHQMRSAMEAVATVGVDSSKQ